jgi:hypothetical protein
MEGSKQVAAVPCLLPSRESAAIKTTWRDRSWLRSTHFRQSHAADVEACNDPRMAQDGLARRGPLAALLGLVILGGLLVWGGWWWTHATVLSERLGGAGIDVNPHQVNEATLHAEVAIPDPHADTNETLTFRSARVHFAENMAGAVGTLSVCVPAEGVGVLGAVSGSLSEFCREVRPIRSGTTIRWTRDSPREYILLTIEPTQPGIARVDEIELTYSRDRKHLWQRGIARARVDLTMRATR